MHTISSAAARLKGLLLLPLLSALSACQYAVFNPAGDVARQQRDLIYISTGLMLLIIVPVLILIVVFAWRYRKDKGGTYDPEFDHSTSLELVIWSAPLLIIIMPMLLLQSVVAAVFMERHWQMVTQRLSMAVTQDIAAIIQIIDTYPQDADYTAITKIAREQMKLQTSIEPDVDLHLV